MKVIIISVIAAIILIGGALALGRGNTSSTNVGLAGNVSLVDGKQIIEIRAKGGYQPRRSFAQANLPTVHRFNTSGTFDCSASVRISSLNISRVLPQSGSTDINIGYGALGILQGSCGMGMYPFEVEFKS